MSSLRLVPVSGPPIEVVNEPSMVGRDPSCEIVVTDGSVSRRHARLERRGSAWWVVDQGSANGSYLNSQRVAEHALQSGQELRFGALAFRVELVEDPEATVATPILDEAAAATLMSDAPADLPRPAGPPVAPPPLPRPAAAPAPPPVPPIPPVAAAPPPVRSAAPRPLPPPPVPQMPGGPPPKKGRSPLFWVITGCCGCLLFGGVLVAVIGGGAIMATRPAANAAQQWLAEVRQNRVDEATAGLSSEYRARLSAEDLQAFTEAIQRSKDATFIQRSVDNDRAVLKGVLTGSGGPPQPITIHLVKEGGAWKVDEVRLGVE